MFESKAKKKTGTKRKKKKIDYKKVKKAAVIGWGIYKAIKKRG